MKKQLFKSAAIKVYSTALITSLMLLSGLKANATVSADSVPPSQVTYLGLENNLVVFNISFDNTTSNKFALELKDGEGQVLYYKKFNDKSFNRKVYLKNVGEDDHVKVTFTITAGSNVYDEAFDINTKKTFVQDYVVTRL